MSHDSRSPSFADLVSDVPIAKLARALKVSPRAAKRIAEGAPLPKSADLVGIADALGLDLATLIFVVDQPRRADLPEPSEDDRPEPRADDRPALDERLEIAIRTASPDSRPYRFDEVVILMLQCDLQLARLKKIRSKPR